MKPISFPPTDWYWIASDGRIYSSARNVLVYSYDFGYVAFIAKNGAASPWPTDINGKQTGASLNAVLSNYGITTLFSG